MDAATRALRAHEVEGAGAFGVDRRATRSAAAELARAADQLRACGKDTRARVAAAAARRGHEACRAWSEEPGCAKALARLGGDEESRAKKRKRGKASDDSADAPSKESGSDENDHIFFEDDRAGEQETLELNPAERRALAEDVHARVGAGGSRAADAVRTAVLRAGRRAGGRSRGDAGVGRHPAPSVHASFSVPTRSSRDAPRRTRAVVERWSLVQSSGVVMVAVARGIGARGMKQTGLSSSLKASRSRLERYE